MAKFYQELLRVSVIALAFVLLFWSACSWARNLDGRYDNFPNHQWYGEQHLTAAAQARMGFASCCSDGDEYPTQFKIVEDGTRYGSESYFYFKDGVWLLVPKDIVKKAETPDGAPHIWLFPYDTNSRVPQGAPICFIIPEHKI